MRQIFFAVAAFTAMLATGAVAQPLVQSQEGIALENQILQLQSQVQQLQGSSGSALGGSSQPVSPGPDTSSPAAAPSNDIVGNLLNQVSQLQAQVQQLNGQIDTLQNQVDTQHAATEKEIGDLNFKVTGGAAPASGIPGVLAPGAPQSLTTSIPGSISAPPPPSVPQSATPASPKAAIAAAQTDLAHRNYAGAESDARTVLATAKSSPEGYKAQFILAEALYGEGKSQDAAIAYDDAYNRSRAGTYAPSSLLGLANALTNIQDQSAACDTLASLNSQFPTPPPGLGPRIEAAEKRAKCS